MQQLWNLYVSDLGFQYICYDCVPWSSCRTCNSGSGHAFVRDVSDSFAYACDSFPSTGLLYSVIL